MKKLIVTVAVLALALALGTTAFAASPYAGLAFADANHDGICDNYGTYPNFVDADGDGVCDNRGTRCTSFADADNDGICDSCNNLHARNNANRSSGCIGVGASGSGHGFGRHHR